VFDNCILKGLVRQAVEATIGNNRENLHVTEITNARGRDDLEHALKYSAPSKARTAYLSGDHDDDERIPLVFRCNYSPERWTEDSLLAYILDPAGYIATEAGAYIESKQEEMLSDFLFADAVAAEYRALVDNPANPVHRVKRIIAAVSGSSAKTITVTIHKDNIDFTFKAEAAEFRSDCTSTYHEWNIKAADRREFERLFGRCAQYGPDDIVRIEYARSVIYEND
jgi:hypothetical protein